MVRRSVRTFWSAWKEYAKILLVFLTLAGFIGAAGSGVLILGVEINERYGEGWAVAYVIALIFLIGTVVPALWDSTE